MQRLALGSGFYRFALALLANFSVSFTAVAPLQAADLTRLELPTQALSGLRTANFLLAAKQVVGGKVNAGASGGRSVPASSLPSSSVSSAKSGSASVSEGIIADKWAILIGIDRFKDPTIPQLKYSAKDARDFADFLVQKGNFAPDHVLLLLNDEATTAKIRDAIGDNWLPKRAEKEDLVLIYASTHGSPKEIDVAGENFLVAYDTDPKSLFATGIRFEDFAPTVKKRTGCDRVVLFLDACNSGAAQVEGKGLVRSNNFDVGELVGEGQVVISSSSSDQRSYESKRYENGVFSHQLIAGLQANGVNTTLNQAFDYLRQQVLNEVRYDRMVEQTPVMRSKWKGKELFLLAVPRRPRKTEGPAYNAALLGKEGSLEALALQDLRNRAAGGDDLAMTELGERLCTGNHMPVNYTEARRWFTNAAEKGNVSARRQLAQMYSRGQGAGRDVLAAIDEFEKAAQAEGTSAATIAYAGAAAKDLGLIYQNGMGITPDKSKAELWFGRAVEKWKSLEIRPDVDAAVALMWLGDAYRLGRGVEKDSQVSQEYYRQACQIFTKMLPGGNERVFFNFGVCYLNGFGVAKDTAQALKYFRYSADRGRPSAHYNLGWMYKNGSAGGKDLVESVRWFARGAELGNVLCQSSLGIAYQDGLGLEKDYAQAVKWYRRAAEQGDSDAQTNLGTCYLKGIGLQPDPAQAVKWYRLAAEQDEAMAFFRLGSCFETGQGVAQDRRLAVQYYTRASAGGVKAAREALERLSK